ncbi:MAG: hypothetical protein Q8O52_04670 [Sulfuritalea sp.]|nr:hypothetical protein [Sulfuritalea sp.]
MNSATFPDFFAAAPSIAVFDPLADFLGAAQGGVIEYGYGDAVRMAGHSCPTVASAFLMTRSALAALYPGTLPERGGIRVEFGEEQDAGVTGVIAAVVTLVTGAAGEGGFKGIGGRFSRRDLLAFGRPVGGAVRFRRVDSGAAVEVVARLDRLPGDPRMARLMPLCLSGAASGEESALFRQLWQERVRRLLVLHADDPDIIEISSVSP